MQESNQRPVTVPTEQAAAYETVESDSKGFEPQGSVAPDSNSNASQSDSQNSGSTGYSGVSLSSGCHNPKSEIKALGLQDYQADYVYVMTRRIIDESHSFFDPGKVNPDFLQFTSNHLGVWGNYAKYLLMTPQEQTKYPLDFREACDELKDTLEFLSESGDMIVTRFKDDYFDKDSGILFPTGTIVATVKRSIFPNLPDMDEGCMELLDPDNYDYSHAVLDFVNKKLKGEFPHRNLWARAVDFDYLSVHDLDKLPHLKRY